MQDFRGYLRLLMVALLLGAALSAHAGEKAVGAPGHWTNSLNPATHWWQPRITLARDGWTEYRIVRPIHATPGETKAAQELACWLERASGARFPIVTDESTPPSKHEISVGRTNRVSSLFPAYNPALLGPGGYTVGFFRHMVFVLGESGDDTLSAAYAFLSEYAGCRWYASDAARVPEGRRLRIPAVGRVYSPAPPEAGVMDVGLMDGIFALRNRANGFLVYSSDTLAAEWGLRLWQTPANQWVTVNRMNRGDVPVSRLLNDFIFGYFGESAREVAQAHDILRTVHPELDELDPALPGGGVLALTPDRLSGEDVNKALTHYLKALEAAQSENIRNKVLRDALPTLHFTLQNNDQNWCAAKEQRYRLFETGARIAGLIQVPCGPQGNDLPLDDALAAWNTVDTVFPAPKSSTENH